MVDYTKTLAQYSYCKKHLNHGLVLIQFYIFCHVVAVQKYRTSKTHARNFSVYNQAIHSPCCNNFLSEGSRPPKIKMPYSMKRLHFLRKALTAGGYLKFVLKILRAPLTGPCHAFNTYFSYAKFAIRLSSYGMRTTVRTDLAIYIENMSASFGLY